MYRSVSGYEIFLEVAPITVKSRMQKIVTISVNEEETVEGVQCAMDVLYIKHVIEYM